MNKLFTELMERMAATSNPITKKEVWNQLSLLLFAGNCKRFEIGLIGPSEKNEVVNQVCVALELI